MVIPIPYTRTNIYEDVDKLLLGKDIDIYVKRTQQYRQNKAKMCSVSLGKFIEAMKNRLEGEESYKNINKELDVILLLLLIKSI